MHFQQGLEQIITWKLYNAERLAFKVVHKSCDWNKHLVVVTFLQVTTNLLATKLFSYGYISPINIYYIYFVRTA